MFSDEEVERLAVAEHDRWISERLEAGWRSGPKDPDRKVTPYLVPFADLPPDIAEYDRIFVREIPVFLACAGMQVIRVPRTDPSTRLRCSRRMSLFAVDRVQRVSDTSVGAVVESMVAAASKLSN